MIVVTGGAGFIGSCVIRQLNCRGYTDILIVDSLKKDEKWRNLLGLHFTDFEDKESFVPLLHRGALTDQIEGIIHLGACSSTTERDAGYLLNNNYRYSVELGNWWIQQKKATIPFLYASSAATYGLGEYGYGDDEDAIDTLRPLNMYAYSKHMFDLYARKNGWFRAGMIGLKYFNVFGPGEYHKGSMQSLIAKSCLEVQKTKTMQLFSSDHTDYADGEQLRDFLYSKDAAKMTLFLYEARPAGGLYNIGSGKASSWNELARALFGALDIDGTISYIPMPEHLRSKYQYFTEADMSKLLSLGYPMNSIYSLSNAVEEYVQQYLLHNRPIGY